VLLDDRAGKRHRYAVALTLDRSRSPDAKKSFHRTERDDVAKLLSGRDCIGSDIFGGRDCRTDGSAFAGAVDSQPCHTQRDGVPPLTGRHLHSRLFPSGALSDHGSGRCPRDDGSHAVYTARPASTILDYRVDDVNWLVRFNGAGTNELRVTGSGVFYRVGPSASEAQRLKLDLTIDDQPVQHFDSGWVKPTVSFPQIDLMVSINMMVGLDTVFGVVAAPVPATQIVRYQVDAGSTRQIGCWAPCDCPL
jgi:hypothetical protein